MLWWYYGSRGARLCLFGHKWVVQHLSKQSFEVTESCNWCGKRRVRALLPADEQRQRERMAHEVGRQARLRLTREMTYIRAQGARGNQGRLAELKKQLDDSRKALADKLRNERRKGRLADRAKIRELMSELSGLIMGK